MATQPNPQFDKEFRQFILNFLDEMGDKLVEKERALLRSVPRRTGTLQNSPYYKVKRDIKTNISTLYVSTKFYGRILDKGSIKTIGKYGKRKGKSIHPEELKEWIEQIGIGNFSASRGKPIHRALNDIAWGIRNAWMKKKKRDGQPWGYSQIKQYLEEDIFDEMLEAYEAFVQGTVVR